MTEDTTSLCTCDTCTGSDCTCGCQEAFAATECACDALCACGVGCNCPHCGAGAK